MPHDRPSDRLSERPSERRNAARTSVVWDALRPALDGGPVDVLDIGGGTGGLAVRVAELGHRVRVVDPSPDALASLDRRARALWRVPGTNVVLVKFSYWLAP